VLKSRLYASSLCDDPYSTLIKCSLLPGANNLCRISYMEGLTRVRVLRRERGLTQQELGRRSGLSPSFLSQVENGNRVPSLSSLTRISAALGVIPIDVLVRDEREISEKNED
jgi:DNA-binding XRE family transcriptional regulator